MTICSAWSRSKKGPCTKNATALVSGNNVCEFHTRYYDNWLARHLPLTAYEMETRGVEYRRAIESGSVQITEDYFLAIPSEEPYTDFYNWMLTLPHLVPHKHQWLFSHRIALYLRYKAMVDVAANPAWAMERFFAVMFNNPNFSAKVFLRVALILLEKPCYKAMREEVVKTIAQQPSCEGLLYTHVPTATTAVPLLKAAKVEWRAAKRARLDPMREELQAVAWAPERVRWCMTLDECQRWD